MWRTDSLWFDAAVVMTIFAIGGILFGRFEEHKSRGRRLLKVAIVLSVTLALSSTAGRLWAYGILILPLLGAVWIHLYWLPKHGINGWTGEPRDKYLELVQGRGKRSAERDNERGAGPPLTGA